MTKKLILLYVGLSLTFLSLLFGLLFTYDKISEPGNYFYVGEKNGSETYLRATAEYEYQIVMEPDSVVVYYLGDTIAKFSYESELGKVLIKDNE